MKKCFVCLLPNSMWQGLLLDPLLSCFGQSGGRHFKLQLDEVSFVITWLQSSVPAVCIYVFLTWIFNFFSEISLEKYDVIFVHYKQWGFEFHISCFFFCRATVLNQNIDGIHTTISSFAASAVCAGFHRSFFPSVHLQREPELSVVLKKTVRCILLCLSSLFICHFTVLSQANMHIITVTAHFLSALAVCHIWPHFLAGSFSPLYLVLGFFSALLKLIFFPIQ